MLARGGGARKTYQLDLISDLSGLTEQGFQTYKSLKGPRWVGTSVSTTLEWETSLQGLCTQFIAPQVQRQLESHKRVTVSSFTSLSVCALSVYMYVPNLLHGLSRLGPGVIKIIPFCNWLLYRNEVGWNKGANLSAFTLWCYLCSSDEQELFCYFKNWWWMRAG